MYAPFVGEVYDLTVRQTNQQLPYNVKKVEKKLCIYMIVAIILLHEYTAADAE